MREDRNNHGRNGMLFFSLLILLLTEQVIVTDKVSSASFSIVFKSKEALEYVLWGISAYFLWRHWQCHFDKIKDMERLVNHELFRQDFFMACLLSVIKKSQPSFNDNSISKVSGNMKIDSFIFFARLVHCGGNGNGLENSLTFFVPPYSVFLWRCNMKRLLCFLKKFWKEDDWVYVYAPFFSGLVAVLIKSLNLYFQA